MFRTGSIRQEAEGENEKTQQQAIRPDSVSASAPAYIPAFTPAPAPPKPSAILRKLTSRIGFSKDKTPPTDDGPSLADVRRAAALQARGLLPASQRYSTVFDLDGPGAVADEFGRGRSKVVWVETKPEGEEGLSAAEVVKRDYEHSRSRSASRTPAPVQEAQEECDSASCDQVPVLSSSPPNEPLPLPSPGVTTVKSPPSGATTPRPRVPSDVQSSLSKALPPSPRLIPLPASPPPHDRIRSPLHPLTLSPIAPVPPLSPSRLPSLSPTTSTAPSSSASTSLRTPSAERSESFGGHVQTAGSSSRRRERGSSLSSADVSEESASANGVVASASTSTPASSYQCHPGGANLVEQHIMEEDVEEECKTRASTVKPPYDSEVGVVLSDSGSFKPPLKQEKRKTLGLFGRRKGVGLTGLPQIHIPSTSQQQQQRPEPKIPSLGLSPSLSNLRKSVFSTRKNTADQNLHLQPKPQPHVARKPQFRSFTSPATTAPTTRVQTRMQGSTLTRTPRVPLSPTMHSRSSIYVGTFGIEDDESRRLSEMAFLDM